ncbi:ABC transporter permease [Ruminococcaceae bacterium OttesenSCG-928-D13]|nr:ABC transporter permease [Ruminococcaceae bacterium OttesenSCG-928-D13]
MTRFAKTTKVLLKKDFKDAFRNINMGIMLLLPPLFAALFRFTSVIPLPGNYLLMLVSVMAMTMIPLSYLATIIAEEKEKNTLRTLMLAGVSAGEFITSKVIVVWVLMQFVNVLDYLVIGYSLSMLPAFFLVTTLGSVSLLMLGAAIGVLSKDQMSTSLISVPVMMALLLPSTMSMMSPIFETIANFSPVEHTIRLFFMLDEGQNIFTRDGLLGLLVLLVWTLLGLGAYLIAYRKRRFDA